MQRTSIPTVHSSLSPHTLARLLSSLDAARNGAAFRALLASFCLAGLMLGAAEADLARDQTWRGALWGCSALIMVFLGVNATGLLLMDQARGRPVRDLRDAAYDSLRIAPRVLLCLVAMVAAAGMLAALMLGLLSLSRIPQLGPLLLSALVPVGVGLFGGMLLTLMVMVGPLTGPSIWAGLPPARALRKLAGLLRWRLLDTAVLMVGVLGISGLVSACVSVVVIGGGQTMALLVPWAAGIELPSQQLMAGLFGRGLRSLGAAGTPINTSAAGLAVQTGGGVVFALALVLPALFYLRGCCAVWLALTEPPVEEAQL
ncbi:hypothetical protein ACS5PK_20600 [Roseateles sp. DB2]|uniref:hypothetical protein n=1 Tax=Roseateles sp. DB2 TaxID=3453717 RepID=UPI003EED85DA